MSAESDEVPIPSTSISISLNVGRKSVHIATYPLASADAEAKAAVIGAAVRSILEVKRGVDATKASSPSPRRHR